MHVTACACYAFIPFLFGRSNRITPPPLLDFTGDFFQAFAQLYCTPLIPSLFVTYFTAVCWIQMAKNISTEAYIIDLLEGL